MTIQLDAFEAFAEGQRGLAKSAARHEYELGLLAPVAWELAGQHPEGITVTEVRVRAEELGLLDGTAKNMHWLGAVMKRAGLASTGTTRRSAIVRTHGKIQVVWRRP